MTDFRIALSPEHLAEGSAEERAAFGHLVVKAGNLLLSEGFDNLVDIRRDGPLVSGYHLAEWLLWHWWRLRCEPSPSGVVHYHGWGGSHRMAEIGEGYVWPAITIASDGFRTLIRSDPSKDGGVSSFRYYGSPHATVLPWSTVERGIDEFVENIMAHTAAKGLRCTNLDLIRSDLVAERGDPGRTMFRRLEALLGMDPDDLPEEFISSRLADAGQLGGEAVEELAAATAGAESRSMLTAEDVGRIALEHGEEMRVGDTPLSGDNQAPSEEVSAVEIGFSAARRVRGSLSRPDGGVDNRSLAELAGVSVSVYESPPRRPPISFTLRVNGSRDLAVLRGASVENRRFDLARLVGDRMIWGESPLRVSTDANTYRQKAQRAFAVELLAPAASVSARAESDSSHERLEEMARDFGVSPILIDEVLRSGRGAVRGDSDLADAA